MRLCRFNDNRLGLVQDDAVFDVTAALDILPASRYPLPTHDLLIANLDAICARVREIAPQASRHELDSVRLLSPVANPGKLVAAPVNYQKHLEEARGDAEIHHQGKIEEIRRIGLFLKATSSLVGPGEGVAINDASRRNDHEIELAAIIGKPCRRVAADQARDYISAYSIGLDMTVRGPEERSMRKSIDTYSVLGPWLVTADEVTDPDNLDFHLTVNGETRQKANTRDLIIGINELIEFASAYYTLLPGDVIYTGTPEGVGPVQAGDTIMAEFAQIGRMEVAVRGT